MNPTRLSIVLTILSSLGYCLGAKESESVLLVVNDASDVSRTIGNSYARLRQLPRENVCHIRTRSVISTNRITYDSEIRDPVGNWLTAHDLQDRIVYIVTTDGLPLWIEGSVGPVGDLASVDSELTLLYRHLLGLNDPAVGRFDNPYFDPYVEGKQYPVFDRDKLDIYLVTRLYSGTGTAGETAMAVSGDSAAGVFAVGLPSHREPFMRDRIEQASSNLEKLGKPVVSYESNVPPELSEPLLGFCADMEETHDLESSGLKWAPGGLAVLFGDTWTGLKCGDLGRQETAETGLRFGERKDGRTGGRETAIGDRQSPGGVQSSEFKVQSSGDGGQSSKFKVQSSEIGKRESGYGNRESAPFRTVAVAVTAAQLPWSAAAQLPLSVRRGRTQSPGRPVSRELPDRGWGLAGRPGATWEAGGLATESGSSVPPLPHSKAASPQFHEPRNLGTSEPRNEYLQGDAEPPKTSKDAYPTPATRNPKPETRNPSPDCPPSPALALLAQGAPAVVFNVADPTSDGYVRPQILFPAYVSGLNLAESVYVASRYLSWRQVVVGDPLMRISAPSNEESEWTEDRDPATGGPKVFAERRKHVLHSRYAADDEAITSLLRAEFAVDHGENEKALDLTNQSLTREPSLWDASRLRAGLLDELGRHDEAYTTYQQLVDSASKSSPLDRPPIDEPEVRRRMARIALHDLNRAELAEPQLQWLVDHQEMSDLDVVSEWVKVKLELGKGDEAEGLLLRLIRQLDPTPAFVLEALGDIASTRDQQETAARYYQRALEAPGADTERIEEKLEKVGAKTALAQSGALDEPAVPSEPVRRDDVGLEQPHPPADKPAESVTELSHPARIIDRPPVDYPEQALREGIEGIVSLRLLIDERGQLIAVQRVRGNPILLKGAERGVHNWTFEPKLVDGRPERDWIEIAIQFKMTKRQ